MATLLIRSRRLPEAVEILERGIKLIPYNPELYRLLAQADLALDRKAEAAALVDRALGIFPEDPMLRQLKKETEDSGAERQ